MIDQTSWLLNRIAELGTDNQPFSIQKSKEHLGYYDVRVGDQVFYVSAFDTEQLMYAYTELQIRIRTAQRQKEDL